MYKSVVAFTCVALAQSVFTIRSNADENLPNPKTTSYLCSASYLARQEVKYSSRDSGTFWDLETRVVSTIAEDYSGSIGGGGESPFGERSYYGTEDGRKVVFSKGQTLKNTKNEKLELSGAFSNGYKDISRSVIEYTFEATFFNKAGTKQVGPEFKLRGEGTQIAEVAKNEFIQVTCAYVKRFKVHK